MRNLEHLCVVRASGNVRMHTFKLMAKSFKTIFFNGGISRAWGALELAKKLDDGSLLNIVESLSEKMHL